MNSEQSQHAGKAGRIDVETAGWPDSSSGTKDLYVSVNHKLEVSHWSYTKAGAKPQALLLSSLANKIPFLSHTVYKVFTVHPVARKEGRAHSWPGFEDGPCCWQPAGLTQVTPSPPPNPSIRMMALSQVVVPTKQDLRMLSTHMGRCHPSSCQGSHSYPQVREQATEARVGIHVWDTKTGQQRC